ncbi:ABC transporter permease [Paenibacillus odorifer]|uniref:ABC transporter permease n=2 Tax=Paenibacillus TaxID=44249 RepID=UPI0015C31544|nr:ABC transporter permease [Paenibacillus odorifer]MEC0222373.1 ABC transporter permease [Paenibacillus odorifer]
MLRRTDMSKQKQRGFAFPTSKKLFWRRLFSHWREQSAIIRTAADWTVLLYILIPGGFLGGRLYYGFWNEALPAWSADLPFMLIPSLLVLLLCRGGLVLLLQEGDLLFLRQRQRWIYTIMFRGLLYSLIVTSLKFCVAFVLLLPFLVRGYGMLSSEVWALFALTLACSWCVKLLGHIVKVQKQGWRRWLWLILAISVPCGIYFRAAAFWNNRPVFMLLIAALFAVVAVIALQRRIVMRGTFMNDVREDYKQRMKIAALLLRGVLDKPRPTRHKPWIFRKSQPLLKSKTAESRFSAAAIKALVRNPAHLKLYLSFTAVSLLAIFIIPSGFKWLGFIVLISLMTNWLLSFWLLFVGDDYIGILPFTKEQKAEAGLRAVPILLFPFSIICSALICISLYGWFGIILFIPLGYIVALFSSRIFGTFRLAK